MYEDYLANARHTSVSYGSYSADGKTAVKESRKIIDVPATETTKVGDHSFVQLKLLKPLNLKDDFLFINTIQGGNRISTDNELSPLWREDMDTLYLDYTLTQHGHNKNFRRWWGSGVDRGDWDYGNRGNRHMISKVEGSDDEMDEGDDIMPAGDYIFSMRFRRVYAMAEEYPILKKIKFRFASHTPLEAKRISIKEATLAITNGRAEIDAEIAAAGKRCSVSSTRRMEDTMTLDEQIAKAKADGYKYIFTKPFERPARAYGCNNSFRVHDYTPSYFTLKIIK